MAESKQVRVILVQFNATDDVLINVRAGVDVPLPMALTPTVRVVGPSVLGLKFDVVTYNSTVLATMFPTAPQATVG